MRGHSGRRLLGLGVVAFLCSALLGPSLTAAAQPARPQLSADLDGKPIALDLVGKWYCHDFAAPKIHCFASAARLEAAVAPTLSASSLTYMTIYDYTAYQGPYMYLSQNYTALGAIGWNDRVSSFIVAYATQSGSFYTDWFYLGTRFDWCCGQGWASLGSFNNTFSSIYQN